MSDVLNATYSMDEPMKSSNKVAVGGAEAFDYEAVFRNFINSHTKVINDNKQAMKSITNELNAAKKRLIEKNAEIKGLNEIIKRKSAELEKYTKENSELQSDVKSLKSELLLRMDKCVTLEVTYDNAIKSYCKKIEACKTSNVQLEMMIEEKSKECKAAFELMTENTNRLNAAHIQMNQLETKCRNALLVQQEIAKKNEEYETKLNELKAELEAKDSMLKEANDEKLKMEEEKNKIIDEQNFKISEIERIFGQPINRVQANASLRNMGTVQPLINAKINDTNLMNTQQRGSNNFHQPAPVLAPRQSQRQQARQSQKPASDKENQQRGETINKRRRRQSPQILDENNFSSDDSDSEWDTKLPPLNDITFGSDVERRSVAGARNVFIAETSESDYRFDKIKRSKN